MATTKTNLFRIIPFVGEDLLCEQEVGNPHDTRAVAVKKVIDGNLPVTVVQHVPR